MKEREREISLNINSTCSVQEGIGLTNKQNADFCYTAPYKQREREKETETARDLISSLLMVIVDV